MSANTKEIKLAGGLIAIVSKEDYAMLYKYSWRLWSGGGRYRSTYVVTNSRGSTKRKMLFMHRMVLNPMAGYISDHINGNSLDNRRENLRMVTKSQNMMNRKKQMGASSKYKGVHLCKKWNNWSTQIKNNGMTRSIYGIDNEMIAGLIYDLLAYDRFKDYAKYNFPKLMYSVLKTMGLVNP